METKQFPNSLYYLTAQLPGKYGYAKMVLEALRDKRSASGIAYTPAIVTNAVRGLQPDIQVTEALEDIVLEYQKKKVNQEKRAAKRAERLRSLQPA